MMHHRIRTGLEHFRRMGAALTAAACALGLFGPPCQMPPAAAASSLQVRMPDLEAQPGETVEVPVSVEQNQGFSGLELVLEHDTALELVTDGDGKPVYSCGDLIGTDTSVHMETGYSKCGIALASSQLIRQEGTLVSLQFRVPSAAQPGDSFALRLTANAAYDNADQSVSVQVTSGSIRVPGVTTTTTTTITTTTTTTTSTTTTTAATSADTTTSATTTETTAVTTTTAPVQTTTETVTTTQVTYQPGDVNMDGEVTVADAVIVLQACAQMAAGDSNPLTPLQQQLADLVQDGEIKVSDAVELLGIVARRIAG